VTLTSAHEATLLAALADVNAAVADAGHPEIRYRLYKVVCKQTGNYIYMWESSWPSGAVYSEFTTACLSGGDQEASGNEAADEE